MTAPNDSSTGGFLVPGTYSDFTPPAYDAALDAIFQPVIAGTSSIPGTLVVPMWQPTMPNMPDLTVDWCAFGVNVHNAPANAYVVHQSMAYDQADQPAYDANLIYDATPQQGQRDVLQTAEDIEVTCAVYGPNSRQNATLIRDGIQLDQNRETLSAAQISFVSAGPVRSVPDLINNLWHRRSDVILYFRRAVVRAYPVLDLVSAAGTVSSDDPSANSGFKVSSS